MRSNPLLQVIERYKWDWPGLVHGLIAPPEPLTDYQRDFLVDIQNGVRQVSIRSGHGVRKTSTLAIAALCQHLTRYPARSVVTAPSSHQLFNAFWSELGKWYRHIPTALQDAFELRSDRFFLKTAPEDSFLSARTAQPDRPEAVAGVHAPHVLMIADEASGVLDPALQALLGSLTDPHATLCLAGNPLRATGFFYDTHNRNRKLWKTYHISCVDNPVVDQAWVENQRQMFGENSNVFRVRVLGEFPLTGDNILIPVYLVDAAAERDVEPYASQAVYWGVDVARFGSAASCLAKRQGNVQPEPVKVWRGLDTMELTGRIVHEYYETLAESRPDQIYVDVIGMGAGVADRLREEGLPAVGINVAETRAVSPQYANLRTELWGRCKDWLERLDCRLHPDDRALLTQLPSLEYTFTSSGKLQLQSKNTLEAPSPDEADAFVLTFAGRAARLLHGRRGRSSGSGPIRRNLPTA